LFIGAFPPSADHGRLGELGDGDEGQSQEDQGAGRRVFIQSFLKKMPPKNNHFHIGGIATVSSRWWHTARRKEVVGKR
jgi:hypothetical protein